MEGEIDRGYSQRKRDMNLGKGFDYLWVLSYFWKGNDGSIIKIYEMQESQQKTSRVPFPYFSSFIFFTFVNRNFPIVSKKSLLKCGSIFIENHRLLGSVRLMVLFSKFSPSSLRQSSLSPFELNFRKAHPFDCPSWFLSIFTERISTLRLRKNSLMSVSDLSEGRYFAYISKSS